MEFISKKEMLQKIREMPIEYFGRSLTRKSVIMAELEELHVIESRPKGKWKGGTTDCFQCSNCNKLSFYPRYVKVTEVEWDYCPYCGADMREIEEGEE